MLHGQAFGSRACLAAPACTICFLLEVYKLQVRIPSPGCGPFCRCALPPGLPAVSVGVSCCSLHLLLYIYFCNCQELFYNFSRFFVNWLFGDFARAVCPAVWAALRAVGVVLPVLAAFHLGGGCGAFCGSASTQGHQGRHRATTGDQGHQGRRVLCAVGCPSAWPVGCVWGCDGGRGPSLRIASGAGRVVLAGCPAPSVRHQGRLSRVGHPWGTAAERGGRGKSPPYFRK